MIYTVKLVRGPLPTITWTTPTTRDEMVDLGLVLVDLHDEAECSMEIGSSTVVVDASAFYAEVEP